MKLPKVIVEGLERVIVQLHYNKQTDIYALCSKWQPEKYAKTQRKHKIPTSLRWKIYRRDSFMCVYCFSLQGWLTLDHVIPETDGGGFTEDNLVTCCGSCNNKKSTKSFSTFLNSKWLRKKRQQNLRRLSTMTAMEKAMLMNGILVISESIGAGNYLSTTEWEELRGHLKTSATYYVS